MHLIVGNTPSISMYTYKDLSIGFLTLYLNFNSTARLKLFIKMPQRALLTQSGVSLINRCRRLHTRLDRKLSAKPISPRRSH